jgi:hypothetical protein
MKCLRELGKGSLGKCTRDGRWVNCGLEGDMSLAMFQL